jgi:hypothetical protein
MLLSHSKIQIDVYINYGDDDVRHKKQVAEPEVSFFGHLSYRFLLGVLSMGLQFCS